MDKNFFKKDFFIIILLLIVIFVLELFGIYGDTFFRDYSFIFEGAYRINLGQIPYQDFFMPVGPVVFYVQAFFNSFLGYNVLSMAVHSFVLAAILCTFFYLIIRKDMNSIFSFIFAFFLFLCFNGFTFYPFYNIMPYFFLFLNIFIFLAYRKKEVLPAYIFFLSAVLTLFGFYSKQDVGILHLFFVFLYFIIIYKNQWKKGIVYYILFSLILIVGTYILLLNIQGFQYWFNLGQAPHSSRFNAIFSARSLWGILTSWKFYAGFFIVIYMMINKFKKINPNSFLDKIFKDKNSLKLLAIFVIISVTTLVSQSTSGLTNNSFVMGDAILLFIIYVLINENTEFFKKQNKITIFYLILVVLLLTISPFAVYGQLLLNYNNPSLGRISTGCYKGILMPNPSLEGLEIIRGEIELNNNNFFSTTEYAFLYCDYFKEPPKNFPLWFDEGITFFPENIPNIFSNISLLNPPIILLQDAHINENSTINDYIKNFLISKGYKDKGLVDAPASYQKTYYSLGYTKTEVVQIEKTNSPITILKKANTSKISQLPSSNEFFDSPKTFSV